jgi:hypothetical protein
MPILPMTPIRDPIHGTIEVDAAEVQVIDHPFFQRLRHVKQLGFGDQAFPGATHTRYAHSLGALHVASRVFDALFRESDVAPADARRFRRALRLAVLLHDLGHPPLSHSSEQMLPRRAALGLERWLPAAEMSGRATHEDYTLKLVADSDLARLLDRVTEGDGFSSAAIAHLITGRPLDAGGAFRAGGLDYGPLLRQVVSSELDADRMDYLLRDSFFTGAAYGRYDLEWLVQNLTTRALGDAVYLALSSRAIFAFEDFLLSRYHMFVSVYYHYKSICYDQMLGHYFRESAGEYEIPADPEAFLEHDDYYLWNVLRGSKSEWAQRIVRRKPYRLLLEVNPMDVAVDRAALRATLAERSIPAFEAESEGELSKYFGANLAANPIFVVPTVGPHRRIDEYTPLFKRYAEKSRLYRVYCHPDRFEEAKALVSATVAPRSPR